MQSSIKLAIVQEAAVYLNLSASLQKAISYIEETAAQGCDMIVFGEAWLTGYPAWLDHCVDYARWDHGPTKEIFGSMHQNSINVTGSEMEALRTAAKKNAQALVMGFNEITDTTPGTIFNSFVIIDSEGKIIVHHRKLMPTYTEKLLYGLGDGRGLYSADLGFAKVGALICWEHWMPLTRQVMHDSGEHIHIALWPQVHEMLQIASRHYAFEGRCFVIAVGQLLKARDLPDSLELKPSLRDAPDTLVLNGGSAVIGPDGKYLLQPQYDGPAVIYFQLDQMEKVLQERMTLDVSGHYQRPDLFQFSLKRS